jgi:hypothetical protein
MLPVVNQGKSSAEECGRLQSERSRQTGKASEKWKSSVKYEEGM